MIKPIDNYVTGGNGFIGKRLMERLRGITIDIPHPFLNCWRFEPFRRFFYLSAYGNMADHTDAGEMIRANVENVGRTLRGIIGRDDVRPESFLFVSSSSVTLPVQTPYSRTKKAAEEMILACPVPGCIVRPYSVIGRGEQPQHLIPTLIRSCMEGAPMNLVPDATHDFIDVDDVVDGMLHCANNGVTGIVEFGSGRPTTNGEVLRLVEEACGRAANIAKVVPRLREFDSTDWYCRKPDWYGKKSLKQSVQEMVEAYRAH